VAQRQYTFNLPELTKNAMICLLMLETIMIINSTICFNCGVGITNGFTKVDTLEYQMAEPDGTLLGNSDLKESKLLQGKCTIQIEI
jgi:uncharacterized membrane protein